MKRITLVASVTLLLVSGAAAARSADMPVDSHDAAGVVTSFGPIESHHGGLRGEVVEYSPLKQSSGAAWVVRLETSSNRRVANAEVQVSAFMPEEPGVIASPAAARYMGGGRYAISGLAFDRAGWWNVSLVVRYRGQVDSLAFNLLLP